MDYTTQLKRRHYSNPGPQDPGFNQPRFNGFRKAVFFGGGGSCWFRNWKVSKFRHLACSRQSHECWAWRFWNFFMASWSKVRPPTSDKWGFFTPYPMTRSRLGRNCIVYLPTMTSTTIHKKCTTRLMDRYSYTFHQSSHAWMMRQSWVLKNGHFWGEITSPLEVKLFSLRKIGENTILSINPWGCAGISRNSKHLKDGEMVTWYVKIMFTSNNSIFKIKKKRNWYITEVSVRLGFGRISPT